MNDIQKKLTEYLIDNHNKQWPDSDYFKEGVSITKLADRFEITESDLITELETMEVTILNGGVLPKDKLFTDFESQKVLEAEQAIDNVEDIFEAEENARVTADFNRMKALGLF